MFGSLASPYEEHFIFFHHPPSKNPPFQKNKHLSVICHLDVVRMLHYALCVLLHLRAKGVFSKPRSKSSSVLWKQYPTEKSNWLESLWRFLISICSPEVVLKVGGKAPTWICPQPGTVWRCSGHIQWAGKDRLSPKSRNTAFWLFGIFWRGIVRITFNQYFIVSWRAHVSHPVGDSVRRLHSLSSKVLRGNWVIVKHVYYPKVKGLNWKSDNPQTHRWSHRRRRGLSQRLWMLIDS